MGVNLTSSERILWGMAQIFSTRGEFTDKN